MQGPLYDISRNIFPFAWCPISWEHFQVGIPHCCLHLRTNWVGTRFQATLFSPNVGQWIYNEFLTLRHTFPWPIVDQSEGTGAVCKLEIFHMPTSWRWNQPVVQTSKFEAFCFPMESPSVGGNVSVHSPSDLELNQFFVRIFFAAASASDCFTGQCLRKQWTRKAKIQGPSL